MAQTYEIHIGERINLLDMRNEPLQVIIITEEQKMVIDLFANTKKDKDLNTVYILNDVEFKIFPVLNIS